MLVTPLWRPVDLRTSRYNIVRTVRWDFCSGIPSVRQNRQIVQGPGCAKIAAGSVVVHGSLTTFAADERVADWVCRGVRNGLGWLWTPRQTLLVEAFIAGAHVMRISPPFVQVQTSSADEMGNSHADLLSQYIHREFVDIVDLQKRDEPEGPTRGFALSQHVLARRGRQLGDC